MVHYSNIFVSNETLIAFCDVFAHCLLCTSEDSATKILQLAFYYQAPALYN